MDILYFYFVLMFFFLVYFDVFFYFVLKYDVSENDFIRLYMYGVVCIVKGVYVDLYVFMVL